MYDGSEAFPLVVHGRSMGSDEASEADRAVGEQWRCRATSCHRQVLFLKKVGLCSGQWWNMAGSGGTSQNDFAKVKKLLYCRVVEHGGSGRAVQLVFSSA